MTPDLEGAAPLLAETGRFVRERVGRATQRPEQPIGDDVLDALTREAVALGILSLASAESEFGLWENCRTASGMAFSLGLLRQVGAVNAGIAFAWHRIALAGAVARDTGIALDADNPLNTTMVAVGHYGMARTSLARWLRLADDPNGDHALLEDWLDRHGNATAVVAPRCWRSMLWPVWRDGRIAWQLCSRDDLDVQSCGAQHGFDEVAAFVLRARSGGGKVRPVSRESSRATYARALTMDLLGLLAIGAGAAAHAQEIAVDYAAVRRQGGKLISGHPAVQLLLSDIVVARQGVEQALEAFTRPIDEIDPGGVVAARASGHDALCLAANQAMQVMGGIGYMRDAGTEKIVRDQNMLKLQSGGTRDGRAFVAGWQGASA